MAEADPWADFADAPGQAPTVDPWAAFEDAPRRKRGKGNRAKPEAKAAPVPSPGDDIIVPPIDGDTLRFESGGALRLWGIDAPELMQQGWNQDGRTVPIGQQSRGALAGLMLDAEPIVGEAVGRSYGRAVAPITLGGADLGEDLARYGNALAAPEYLKSDPDRRFDYMQAERLARQNRLGIHDTMFQPPEEFRDEPMPVPSRETVAQFWDTPTPMAGLRPEIEQGYLAITRTGTAADILAYAEANGFLLDPSTVQKFVGERNAGKKFNNNVVYEKTPEPLTDLGDGKTGAAARGFGNGVLPNFLEEAGAIPDTFGLIPGRENVFNSDRRLADIYSNNLGQNEAIIGFDRSAHPYITGAAEVAGGVVLPIRRVRSAADLAKWGGAFGAVSGLGQDGTIPLRMTSGVVGAGIGLGTTVLGGKALEAAPPYAGQLWRRVRGNGHEGTPAAPVAAPNGIPAPPEGFTPDAPLLGSMAMQADEVPAVSQDVPRQRDYLFPQQQPTRMDQPLTPAQVRAASERVDPRDVLPVPSNMVGDVEEAAAVQTGRNALATAANEKLELARRTVKAWNGSEVPKVGPIDMVGWLRLQGGVQNQGDELSHMGLDNRARKLDFAGQEQRFGPLVNDAGMNLDDAAMRAWEAGYFPDHTERPDVNTFLNALRDTHEGRNRRFLSEDLPEIDRYYATQQERYDLEQQRIDTGGPVYTDRSVPADEPAPFPPVEAYEEWPSGGPDFAGNIRLEKLESPQDISRALDFTERRVGFDAAARGRATHAETERLASELGMTPEALISRRNGQALNAEEALAARQILATSGNELVNAAKRIRGLDEPGDELLSEFRHKWVRHVARQEQVAGMTAEAGRALQQFRMAASSRAVRGDVLSALVRGGGGTHNLKEAAETLLDAVETSPGVFNAVSKKALQRKWRRLIGEVYINFLLSNPATHVVNLTSNTLTAMAQIPEHATASLIGKARQMFSRNGTDRIIASEVGARMFGLMQGAREGSPVCAGDQDRRALGLRLQGRGRGLQGGSRHCRRGAQGAHPVAHCRG